MAAVVGVGATSSGLITAATGPRRPMQLGFTCGALAAILTAAGGLTGSPTLIITGLAAIGLVCLAMPAMTSVAVNASPAQHTGLAGGMLNTSRQIGGAIGVAVLGAVLNAGGVHAGFPIALTI